MLVLRIEAINSSNITYPDATMVAQYFGQLGNIPGFETALQKMIVLSPNEPEPRFHLAEVMAVTSHPKEAMQNLQAALDLSRKQNPANPMFTQAQSDPNFTSLRSLPEFQKMVSGH